MTNRRERTAALTKAIKGQLRLFDVELPEGIA